MWLVAWLHSDHWSIAPLEWEKNCPKVGKCKFWLNGVFYNAITIIHHCFQLRISWEWLLKSSKEQFNIFHYFLSFKSAEHDFKSCQRSKVKNSIQQVDWFPLVSHLKRRSVRGYFNKIWTIDQANMRAPFHLQQGLIICTKCKVEVV